MCGLCGVWQYGSGEPVSRDQLRRMTDTLLHRGPDDGGAYFDDTAGVGFGFRRLAIIDLSAAAHQPMHNEDESVWAMCNGEIYNFAALRPRLEAAGHVFASHSDTEVLVHAYEAHGDACIADLDGMFALAIWDTRRRRLVLARDPLGKKPLYYHDDGRRLLFASELKALVAGGVPRTLDWTAVGEFLSLGNVSGAHCILAGVRKLLPGHLLVCEGGQTVTRSYWDWLPSFRQPRRTHTEIDWPAELRAALHAAVRKRLISDVPLGAFLSGGIDSSAIVATMAQLSAHPVKTFSVGFDNPQYNELDYAREVAQRFGTEHHELIVQPEGVRDMLPRLVRQFDEPFADWSAVPTYYLSKLARQQVTVVLSGDGGDESCAGYARYTQALRERWVDTVPQRLRKWALLPFAQLPIGVPGRRRARRLALDATQRYVAAMRMMPPDEIGALLTTTAAHRITTDGAAAVHAALEAAADLDPLSRMQYTDAKVYLPDDILVKIDRASMLNALEVRCPFLDRDFLELMAAVPPHLRLSGEHGKALLRRAMQGVLPERILNRPKMGFGVPFTSWFRHDLAAFIRDVLLDPRTRQREIFAPQALEALVGAHRTRAQLTPHLWATVVFELWCRAYLDEA